MPKKQNRAASPPEKPVPVRPIVPPLPPVVDEADRQGIYDSSISEFESDGVRDAESGDRDPDRNFVEPEPKGERRNPKR